MAKMQICQTNTFYRISKTKVSCFYRISLQVKKMISYIIIAYVMPELAVTTQNYCIALDFLLLCFWSRVILLQD